MYSKICRIHKINKPQLDQVFCGFIFQIQLLVHNKEKGIKYFIMKEFLFVGHQYLLPLDNFLLEMQKAQEHNFQ